jgi:hypothetical protein
LQDITLHPQRLGSGSYGSVFKVCTNLSVRFWCCAKLINRAMTTGDGARQGELRGSEVAVKCISLPEGNDTQEQLEKLIANFRNECAIMTYASLPRNPARATDLFYY